MRSRLCSDCSALIATWAGVAASPAAFTVRSDRRKARSSRGSPPGSALVAGVGHERAHAFLVALPGGQ
jgi:hypothetical protein